MRCCFSKGSKCVTPNDSSIGYIGKFDKGYEAMGYIIIASSVFSIFMRIKGQKTMFGTLEDQ